MPFFCFIINLKNTSILLVVIMLLRILQLSSNSSYFSFDEIDRIYHDYPRSNNMMTMDFEVGTGSSTTNNTRSSTSSTATSSLLSTYSLAKFAGPGTMWIKETHPNTFGDGLKARTYSKWPLDTLALPCYEAERDWKTIQRQNVGITTRGFLFQRPYKCGSTSSIGMVLRFLHKLAISKGYKHPKMCQIRLDHGWLQPKWGRRFANRNHDKSFLWTIIRDPSQRSVSQYYFFKISHSRRIPTDTNFLQWIRNTKLIEDYYIQTLLTDYEYQGRRRRRRHRGSTTNGGLEAIRTILNEYNFIGITERFDESAIVMAMLLNIPLGDLLYLSVKESGGFDYAWRDCMYIVKPYISPGMRAYFDSQEWKDKIKYDAMLYRAVNRSLDLTIESLGPNTFYHNLEKFQTAIKVANEQCTHKVVNLCTEGGEVVPAQNHDCLWDNAACGMSCLDDVARKLKLPMTEFQ